ncbi:MAG TPA: arginine deiminase family protein [Chroococcidiopsis sp.]
MVSTTAPNYFSVAIARLPGPDFAQGQTTYAGTPATAQSYDTLLAQHRAYLDTLRGFGLEVIVLDALPGFPDAYFVEDTAVVTPHVAVITRPGAPSRQGEEATIADVLAQYRPIAHITAPGTVDGGDVMMVGNHFFIGLSDRTNASGAEQLGQILAAHGHTWETVPVAAGLHLKSSVNWVGGNTLLLSADFADLPAFAGYDRVVSPKEEDYACNTLWVNDRLIVPSGFPTIAAKLASLGHAIATLDMSEVQRMDGGLSCLSLRF